MKVTIEFESDAERAVAVGVFRGEVATEFVVTKASLIQRFFAVLQMILSRGE